MMIVIINILATHNDRKGDGVLWKKYVDKLAWVIIYFRVSILVVIFVLSQCRRVIVVLVIFVLIGVISE